MADFTGETAKLTYFHGWGLAEQLRWVLAATNTPFDNVCLDTHAQMQELRAEGRLLFGQLPLLEIDGLQLTQSQAMVRYVAARGGISGATPAEVVLVDMVAEGARDARGIVVGTPFAPNRAEHLAKLPVHLDKYLPKFEAILAKAASGGVLASGALTYADVLLGELLEGLEGLQPGCTAAATFPLLAALRAKIRALPGVVAYLASDKRYPFPAEGAATDAYVKNVNTVLGR